MLMRKYAHSLRGITFAQTIAQFEFLRLLKTQVVDIFIVVNCNGNIIYLWK